MQEYGVARNTARRAIGVLADEGLITVRQGWGTFVKPRG
jgi:DNA-binding GntR family transcriptional regulator